MSSQDKGICEQTEILIVAFCLAECSPSNICLYDTQGLPRAVGCPSAARPRLGDAHQRDLLPSHLAAALAAAPKLTNFRVPWQACTHGFRLAAVLGSCVFALFTHHSQTTWELGKQALEKDCPAACRGCPGIASTPGPSRGVLLRSTSNSGYYILAGMAGGRLSPHKPCNSLTAGPLCPTPPHPHIPIY